MSPNGSPSWRVREAATTRMRQVRRRASLRAMALLAVSRILGSMARSASGELGCIIGDMNDTQWLTAADASTVLRCSIRQVHRYGEQKQLVTRRAGRRVLFSAESVAQLADELAVDVRPPAARQEMIPAELLNYLREQAEIMRRQGDSTSAIERQIAELRADMRATPAWARALTYAVIALAVLVAIAIVVLVVRSR